MLTDLEKSILRELHTKLVKTHSRSSFVEPAKKIETLLFGSDSEKRKLAKEYASTETLPIVQREVQRHNSRGQELLKRQRDLADYLGTK